MKIKCIIVMMGILIAGFPKVVKGNPEYGRPALSILPAGDIKPQGWIREQMTADLTDGLISKFSNVSNIGNNNVFVKRDGTLADPYAYEGGVASRSWWLGEVEGNLMDSLVRTAFLTENAQYKAEAAKKINDILDAQAADPDGYIGMYAPENRFAMRTEKHNNGELWTQSYAFRVLLAYYEFTKEKRVLDAVMKGVDWTLANYEGKEVFQQGSGVSHGIAFTDILEWLYRLTGDAKYAKAMQWLYDDFSQKENEGPKKADADLSYDELKYPDRLWWSHTPHTMEGIHTPIITHIMTGDEKYAAAAGNVLMKYDRHDTPGGGVVGDEGIDRRLGTSMLPREYCTMVSGVIALNRIAAWAGDLSAGRRAATIIFNSAQGARLHPALTAVRYLSHDNQKDASGPYSYGGRYYYAANHAAPCCATTAGRLLPYYVESMWLADHPGNRVVANNYGPNRLSTELAGRKIGITVETDYPFSDRVKFIFDSDAETMLVLRKPAYSGNIAVDAAGAAVDISSDAILIHGTWEKGAAITVDFDFQPRLVKEPYLENSYYYRWGELLFSLPLGEDREANSEYQAEGQEPSGCFLWKIKPVHPERWNYRIDPQESFILVDLPGGSRDFPYANPLVGLKGKMIDPDGEKVEVMLTPLGSSILRRTAFPDYTKPVVDPQKEWIKHKGINPDGTMTEAGAKKKAAH